MHNKRHLKLALPLCFLLLGAWSQGYAQGKSKLYVDLSEAEQQAFIARAAEGVAIQFGNRNDLNAGEKITPVAVATLKPFVDAYAKRTHSSSTGLWSESLSAVLKRYGQNEAIITRAFQTERRDQDGWFSPRLGVYLAMTESEFRPCLEDPAGMKGMFQLSAAVANNFGLRVTRTVDERCEAGKAAAAAAKILKYFAGDKESALRSLWMLARYHRGPKVRLPENDGFWQFMARTRYAYFSTTTQKTTGHRMEYRNEETEVFKYLHKLFAAAMVIENPEYFATDLPSASSGADPRHKDH